jgi:hypothetical protein
MPGISQLRSINYIYDYIMEIILGTTSPRLDDPLWPGLGPNFLNFVRTDQDTELIFIVKLKT